MIDIEADWNPSEQERKDAMDLAFYVELSARASDASNWGNISRAIASGVVRKPDQDVYAFCSRAGWDTMCWMKLK